MSSRKVLSESPRHVLLRQLRAGLGSSAEEFASPPVPQVGSVLRSVSSVRCVSLRSRVAFAYGPSPKEALKGSVLALRQVAQANRRRRIAERLVPQERRSRPIWPSTGGNPESSWRPLGDCVGAVIRKIAPRFS